MPTMAGRAAFRHPNIPTVCAARTRNRRRHPERPRMFCAFAAGAMQPSLVLRLMAPPSGIGRAAGAMQPSLVLRVGREAMRRHGERERRLGSRGRRPSCRSLDQSFALQDVVGEGMPEHDGSDLDPAAYRQADEVPIAPPSMDALADRAFPIQGLSGLACHPLAPSEHAGAVIPARRVGVAPLLGFGRRTVDLDLLGMGPFDVLAGTEAAIGEVALRPAPQALADLLERGPDQTSVRADIDRVDRDDDLRVSGADDLNVVGRAEAAIRHLHDAGLGIARRCPRLLLLLGLVAVSYTHLRAHET